MDTKDHRQLTTRLQRAKAAQQSELPTCQVRTQANQRTIRLLQSWLTYLRSVRKIGGIYGPARMQELSSKGSRKKRSHIFGLLLCRMGDLLWPS